MVYIIQELAELSKREKRHKARPDALVFDPLVLLFSPLTVKLKTFFNALYALPQLVEFISHFQFRKQLTT